ncbi:MAG: hypothetical protein ABI597_01770 [Gammaproteobacteria bacterium]
MLRKLKDKLNGKSSNNQIANNDLSTTESLSRTSDSHSSSEEKTTDSKKKPSLLSIGYHLFKLRDELTTNSSSSFDQLKNVISVWTKFVEDELMEVIEWIGDALNDMNDPVGNNNSVNLNNVWSKFTDSMKSVQHKMKFLSDEFKSKKPEGERIAIAINDVLQQIPELFVSFNDLGLPTRLANLLHHDTSDKEQGDDQEEEKEVKVLKRLSKLLSTQVDRVLTPGIKQELTLFFSTAESFSNLSPMAQDSILIAEHAHNKMFRDLFLWMDKIGIQFAIQEGSVSTREVEFLSNISLRDICEKFTSHYQACLSAANYSLEFEEFYPYDNSITEQREEILAKITQDENNENKNDAAQTANLAAQKARVRSRLDLARNRQGLQVDNLNEQKSIEDILETEWSKIKSKILKILQDKNQELEKKDKKNTKSKTVILLKRYIVELNSGINLDTFFKQIQLQSTADQLIINKPKLKSTIEKIKDVYLDAKKSIQRKHDNLIAQREKVKASNHKANTIAKVKPTKPKQHIDAVRKSEELALVELRKRIVPDGIHHISSLAGRFLGGSSDSKTADPHHLEKTLQQWENVVKAILDDSIHDAYFQRPVSIPQEKTPSERKTDEIKRDITVEAKDDKDEQEHDDLFFLQTAIKPSKTNILNIPIPTDGRAYVLVRTPVKSVINVRKSHQEFESLAQIDQKYNECLFYIDKQKNICLLLKNVRGNLLQEFKQRVKSEELTNDDPRALTSSEADDICKITGHVINTPWVQYLGSSFANLKLIAQSANIILHSAQAETPLLNMYRVVDQANKAVATTIQFTDTVAKLLSDPFVNQLSSFAGVKKLALAKLDELDRKQLQQHLSQLFSLNQDEPQVNLPDQNGLTVMLNRLVQIHNKAVEFHHREPNTSLNEVVNNLEIILPELKALNSDRLKPAGTLKKVSMLLANLGVISRLFKKLPDAIASLKNISMTFSLEMLREFNLLLRDFTLLLDKLEIEFYMKEGYLTNMPLFTVKTTKELADQDEKKGEEDDQDLVKVSLHNLIKSYHQKLADNGYEYLPRERYPYIDEMLTQRQRMLKSAHSDFETGFLQRRITSAQAQLNELAILDNATKAKESEDEQLSFQNTINDQMTQRIDTLERQGYKSAAVFTKIRLLQQTRENKVGRVDEKLDNLGKDAKDREMLYLLYEGKTGKMMKQLRHIGKTRENVVNFVELKLIAIQQLRKQAIYLFGSSRKQKLENKIHGLQIIKECSQKPGYCFNDCLDELSLQNKDAYHMLIADENTFLNELRNLFDSMSSKSLGRKQIDCRAPSKVEPVVVPPPLPQQNQPVEDNDNLINNNMVELHQPLLARDNDIKIINTKIRLLSNACWVTECKRLKVKLLETLSLHLQTMPLDIALKKTRLAHPKEYYLLHEGRTGKMIETIEQEKMTRADCIHAIQLEISRLKDRRTDKLYFFAKSRKNTLEIHIHALIELSEAMSRSVDSVDVIIQNLTPRHRAILLAEDSLLLTKIKSCENQNLPAPQPIGAF